MGENKEEKVVEEKIERTEVTPEAPAKSAQEVVEETHEKQTEPRVTETETSTTTTTTPND